MNKSDILNALKERVRTGGLGIAGTWPAVDPPDDLEWPWFELQFVASQREGEALDGTVKREVGRMSVTIVVEEGTGETAANDYADDVADLFPQGLRIPITGGEISIRQQADIRIGVRSSPDWRVPVIIGYVAVNT